jgi:hypothetical protein
MLYIAFAPKRADFFTEAEEEAETFFTNTYGVH